jgi:hypothetical protein
MTVLLLILCHLPPSSCANYSNKSTMVGVMTEWCSDADAPKPLSQVGFPPQDVVTLRGDPPSPPPHLPCPLPPGSSPALLTKMAGHVNQRHGVHLLGNCVVVLVARGSEVDVQVS